MPLLDDSHVAMKVNLDACIHCIYAFGLVEVQVNDVIGMAGRGRCADCFRYDDLRQSTCVAVGNAQACPTGALM